MEIRNLHERVFKDGSPLHVVRPQELDAMQYEIKDDIQTLVNAVSELQREVHEQAEGHSALVRAVTWLSTHRDRTFEDYEKWLAVVTMMREAAA